LKKLVTKEDLTIQWLKKECYSILFPKDPIIRIILCSYLYRIGIEDKQMSDILKVTHGVSRATIYNYKKANFNISDHQQKQKRNTQDNIQQIDIIRSDNKLRTKYTFQFTIRELEENKPVKRLSIEKAIKVRDNLIIEQDVRSKEFKTQDEILEVVEKICILHSSGRVDIYEALYRCKVSHADFFRWVIQDDIVKQMYEESIMLAKFITESQIYTLSSNIILDRLRSGYLSSTSTQFDYIWVNGKREPIEKTKKTLTKQISITDLIKVLQLLRNDLSAPKDVDVDEFDKYTEEELFEMFDKMREKKDHN